MAIGGSVRGEGRTTRVAAGLGRATGVTRSTLALLSLAGLLLATSPQARSAPPWLLAEGGAPHGRGDAWRERRERRDAMHEERARRQREGWERRERMTPEERRSLRRDLHEANRDLYRP